MKKEIRQFLEIIRNYLKMEKAIQENRCRHEFKRIIWGKGGYFKCRKCYHRTYF